MTTSVQKNWNGPIWPLGNIVVGTPGTPVRITSLIDSGAVNAPEAATSATSNEYTVRAQELIFQACKAGASHGTQLNTGNIYIIYSAGAGSNNRDDPGSIVATIPQGSSGVYPPVFRITAAALNRNTISPYDFYIDADNANDGCQVSMVIA